MLKDNGEVIPEDTSAFSFSLCQYVYVSSSSHVTLSRLLLYLS